MLHLLFILFALTSGASNDYNKHRILEREIEALTFHHGAITTGRRLPGVLALQCIPNHEWNCHEPIESVQCQNKGWDGLAISWRCEATMPVNFTFKRTEVSCEGWENFQDEYILAGSCGLKYELKLVNKVEQNQPVARFKLVSTVKHESSSFNSFVAFFIILILLLLLIVFFVCLLAPSTTESGVHHYHHEPCSSSGGSWWNGWLFGRLTAPSYSTTRTIHEYHNAPTSSSSSSSYSSSGGWGSSSASIPSLRGSWSSISFAKNNNR